MNNSSLCLNLNSSAVCKIKECDQLSVYSQQQLKFFDPSFFFHVNTFKEFFLPTNTVLDIPTIIKYQKRDPVLTIFFTCITQNNKHQKKHLLYLQIPFY